MTKCKFINFWLLYAMLLLSINTVHAQEALLVHHANGTTVAGSELENVRHITFSGNNLSVNSHNGDATVHVFDDIAKIIFGDISGALPPVATPVISPTGGNVNAPLTVSITCTTKGATIYYTTNGTNPTTTSDVYTTSFTLRTNTTVKAFATMEGMANSPVASATYIFPEVVDIAITAITAPVSGDNLTATETVTVIITNNGTKPVTGFDLELTVDNTVVATESIGAGGINLVDGTFENGMGSWNPTYYADNYTIVSTEAYEGTQSLQVIIPADANGGKYDGHGQLQSSNFAIVSGHHYQVSFWIKGSVPGKVAVDFKNANFGNQYPYVNGAELAPVGTNWTQVIYNTSTVGNSAMIATTNDAAMWARLLLAAQPDVTYWIDNIEVRDLDASSMSIVSLAEYTYTFTATADLSAKGKHAVSVRAIMVGDEDASNDVYTVTVINNDPTGISDINNKNEISIYQNNSGEISITVSENATVQVIDMNGRVLGTYSAKANAALTIQQSSGIYLFKVISNNEVSTHKVVIR
ncbi:MAG: chitobiase/beta-hexosaminidase C-terminal domain-containing protein [Dysgonamonadaceae bacterium]|jgi:hypothetical protein|nr:chitobiase/beta-hexosaminidase C-terminal domain-containing protein [Dysgonamonadaceae bacterium]